MTSSDALSQLPIEVADALGESYFRVAGARERDDAVAEVLAAHPECADLIRSVVADWDSRHAGALPRQIGPYRILDWIGRGGYGEVYLAEQSSPIQRRVALKVLNPGVASAAVLRRFRWEQEVLARLNHDAIARIYDAGGSIEDRAWIAMELVEGQPITRFCEGNRLGLTDRLRLVIDVCHGVQHAHQLGLIHRDIKPANVLVAEAGDRFRPKLIDFGIARSVGPSGLGITEAGAVLGTPAYMAPEQLAAEPGNVDTRTDVYALGVLLFELITCTLPFDGVLAKTKSWSEIARVLTTEIPRRPSLVAIAPQSPAFAWRRRLVGDLDWIVLKAMAREPEHRYASAEELAQDLGSYLAHQPVLAGPPTATYRLRKFLQRHRGKVMAGSTVMITAVVGAALTARYAWLASERAAANALLAEEARAATVEAEAAATRLARSLKDFRSLAGVVVAENARRAQAALYPAWPELVPALQSWLDQEGVGLSDVQGEVASTLTFLRAEALPWTPEEQLQDRATHPRRAELEVAERRRDSLRRQLELLAGAPLEVPQPPAGSLNRSPTELATMARIRTGLPAAGRATYGEEAQGLSFARAAAVAGRGTADEDGTQWALAWALVDNGQDAEALAIGERLHAQSQDQGTGGYEGQLSLLRQAIESRGRRLAEAEAECAGLAEVVAARRTWRFSPDKIAESFLHATLVELSAKVEGLLANEVEDVRARLLWATALRDRGLSSDHPNAPATWAAARAAIAASPIYSSGAINLPSDGLPDLVPLGVNPDTGLWQFYHLPSAWDGDTDPLSLPIPRPDAHGRVQVGDATGIVFVLVPGGVAQLGSQARDPSQPLYDGDRAGNEDLHQVSLSPFLVAAHELTQGQWRRLMRWDASRREPSAYRVGSAVGGVKFEWSNPVENVGATEFVVALRRYGLDLPSEAQWEYAARAGSTTPWFVDASQLQEVGNFADAVTQRLSRTWTCEPWSDGFGAHAPVGRFLPNKFGLFDVHGNVSEWCRDPDSPYGSERSGDGLRASAGPLGQRYHRGGNWANVALKARSACRGTRVDGPDSTVGVRVVRNL